jgi:hypothetical protein
VTPPEFDPGPAASKCHFARSLLPDLPRVLPFGDGHTHGVTVFPVIKPINRINAPLTGTAATHDRRSPPRLVAFSVLFALCLGTFIVNAPQADAMRRVRAPYPRTGTAPAMEAAIRSAFPAHLHRQALNVAWCESRGKANARNGQYKGHFQIGRREWATFGKGGNPYNAHHNAAAAYRYYKVAGWRPWECKP